MILKMIVTIQVQQKKIDPINFGLSTCVLQKHQAHSHI
jgi:hypothetical protein